MIYTCTIDTPLGEMLAAAKDGNLTGLWFVRQKYYPPFAENPAPDYPVFAEARRWLSAYFAGGNPDVTPPLAPEGTAFRRAVWAALLRIPYGETASYGGVAAQLEREQGGAVSARAVGGAVGHNPVSLIIPCHRVIGSDGSLTGYGGGIERKKALLALEKAHSSAKD
ncbi:methylated-DNA--[protein]-cysteine S-methyltransferase [Treponema endosymbiont of Eucomonympha sp.]|uniref:methylated-DNA--[protein]-cysteine S-methyltransferase n=1 Tax=Treponema endosymbiont of Eucomonympha sp. TaxID=1580831 RepID=UPI0007817FCB|nr:methylated-DNA--[protein]-cysteine S-methyltransferase [Treponema endosymbiont of Eucomonympha sp.]